MSSSVVSAVVFESAPCRGRVDVTATHGLSLRALVCGGCPCNGGVVVTWSRCGDWAFRRVTATHSSRPSAGAGARSTGRLSPATRAVAHVISMTLSLVMPAEGCGLRILMT